MFSKKIVFVLSVVCLFFSLNACSSKGGNSSQNQNEESQIATVDNSQTALNWEGEYSGVVPCADCAGIETKISLKSDSTFHLSWKYSGKDDQVYVKEGKFVWNSAGSIITLENIAVDEFPTMYKVCENYLLQLDLKGNVIIGETADKYRLNKN
jgi:uncharacterized lipoprotein NlpE involved in copper resistance